MATKFRNAGQTCSCANRVYVERPVYAAFKAKLTDAVDKLRVGDGLDEQTDIGPIIDQQGMHKLMVQLEDAFAKGATVYGGLHYTAELPRFFPPTILSDVTPDMLVCREETFGPIVPLLPFDSEAEVIQAANDTPYGLVAYYYTRDLERAVRLAEALEYGVVGVNDAMPTVAHAPFGGLKESGLGKEGGHQGLAEFMDEKYLSLGLSL
jgi:succinate-semialdehyde dehydrogenase/glutarate-semialdehyde dehydrogenase